MGTNADAGFLWVVPGLLRKGHWILGRREVEGFSRGKGSGVSVIFITLYIFNHRRGDIQ